LLLLLLVQHNQGQQAPPQLLLLLLGALRLLLPAGFHLLYHWQAAARSLLQASFAVAQVVGNLAK
jgi:phosphoglycerol transferase MdoB-like AlkP superfamily enzyme